MILYNILPKTHLTTTYSNIDLTFKALLPNNLVQKALCGLLWVLLLITLNGISGSQNLRAQSKDTSGLIHRYELFAQLRHRLPSKWEINMRKESNKDYFAIIYNDSWRINRSQIYKGPPEKEGAWAKANGEDIDFEIHLIFEPADNYVAQTARGQQTTSSPITSTTTTKEPNKEIIKELEEKYKIDELEKSENTKTYTAYTKEEKDRLVYFMLSKEYYTPSGSSTQTVIIPPTVPKNNDNSLLYVKDYSVRFEYRYPLEEYQPYPKSILNDVENIENLIRNIINDNK